MADEQDLHEQTVELAEVEHLLYLVYPEGV
jgi:hypothetical protein